MIGALPDHLLVHAQGLLGDVLDEGRVLKLDLCRDGEDEGGRVQDVHLHLGVCFESVVSIAGLGHLENVMLRN